MNIFVPG